MGNNYDIILIGLVAVFLILRLRSVLGKRTGSEQPPARDPFTPPAPPQTPPRVGDAAQGNDNVVPQDNLPRAACEEAAEESLSAHLLSCHAPPPNPTPAPPLITGRNTGVSSP